ncbi:MAG: hypothetical protein HY608_04865, partial [Planctomycetes bacterium]|nr:hypothetical protein [Planctomycetota bacterium]
MIGGGAPWRRGKPRGIVLILVSVLLILLMLLGVTFVQMSVLRVRVMRDWILGARASLLARSGLERAAAELHRGALPEYGGEDWNGDGALTVGPERDNEVYLPDALNVEDCPPAYAMRPTFFSRGDSVRAGVLDAAGDPAPDTTAVDGRKRGFSGRLRGTLVDTPGVRGETYALRVIDLSGRIDLNLPDTPVYGGAGRMARLLDNLGMAIAAVTGGADPIAGRGAQLVQKRIDLQAVNGRGYLSVGDLRLAGLTEAEAERLRPYVWTEAWYDPGTVTPTLDGSGLLTGLAVQPRAPVNVQTAPTPVLAALMALEGDGEKVRDFDAGDVFQNPPVTVGGVPYVYQHYLIPMTRVRPSIPLAKSLDLAAALAARRRLDRFDTWAEFDAWCDSLPAGIDPWQAALIQANANPNTRLNKYSPDPAALRRMDKADLVAPTTEFRLDAAGPYEIVSVGRVLDTGGALLARAEATAVRAAPSRWREGSQTRFEAAGASRERVVTLPEPLVRSASPTAWDGQVVLARAEDLATPDITLRAELQTGLDGVSDAHLPTG